MVKGIFESAYGHGADMIVTPWPVCQMNTEVNQEQVNNKHGSKSSMPVVYHSRLLSVAYEKDAKQVGRYNSSFGLK
jgi:heterodisulfide reductase subunit B